MRYLSGREAIKFLTDTVYEKKQVNKHTVDLTADCIYKIAPGARLDFGGGEFSPAPRRALKPKLNKPSDEYGWWQLKKGMYMVRYNEMLKIPPRHKAFIEPNLRLLKSGVIHPSVTIEESGEILLPLMCIEDTHIKENARISCLRMIKEKE